MSVTVLCYERCTTCKKALQWLDARGVDYVNRPIKAQNPTEAELRAWREASGLPLKRFFNTSGQAYRDLNLKDRLPGMDEAEQLRLLASDGMLVKRPLLVAGEKAYPGFREAEWSALLGLDEA